MNHILPNKQAPFSFIDNPFPLLKALIAGDDLLVQGELYHPAMDNGPAALKQFGMSGYVWPYLQRGQDIGDLSHMWFFLLGFRAPSYALIEFSEIASNMRKLISGECYEFDFTNISVAKGISAESPAYLNPPLQAVALGLRDLMTQRFLDLSKIEHPVLVMSTAPCPDPFSWGIPDTSDLEIPEV